jgi:hypothetical protein
MPEWLSSFRHELERAEVHMYIERGRGKERYMYIERERERRLYMPERLSSLLKRKLQRKLKAAYASS